MERQVINPESLWDASNRSYSHVVKVINPEAWIFVAGQAAVETVNGELSVVGPGDIELQTRRTLENIQKELEAAGATMADIVDMTVFLRDVKGHQWPVRKVREEFFEAGNFPVSTMVEISRLAIDGLLIEIDVIAAI